MLQTLLADRFRLKTHKELKEMAVCALVVGPNGARLTPLAGEPGQTVPTGQGSAVLRTLTLSGLARALSSASGRLVIDETHLSGEYDIVLEFEPEVPFARSIEGMGDSMFAAVQKQLGLKLVPRRAPVEVIVIDQAERPTAN